MSPLTVQARGDEAATPFPPGSGPAVLLRRMGLRATSPRLLVLEAMVATAHPTVEELTRRLAGTGINVSTVYRTLTSFERAGLVGRLQVQDGVSRYLLAGGGDHGDHGGAAEHLHLWCRGCGQVLDVADRGAHEAVRAAVVAAGLPGEVGQLTVSGLCRTCGPR